MKKTEQNSVSVNVEDADSDISRQDKKVRKVIIASKNADNVNNENDTETSNVKYKTKQRNQQIQQTVPLSEDQMYVSNMNSFDLKPRFNLWGWLGDHTATEAQVLAPLYGDDQKVLYFITEGNYIKNDKNWMLGAGFGYRQIVDNKIYGVYGILDYLHTDENGFAIFNPGLEALGVYDVWDFNVNAYLPVSTQRKLVKEGWAGDDFGDYRFINMTGHKIYDHKLSLFEEPCRGFDFEIGRTIPFLDDLKLYIGAYHFDSKYADSINGIETRLVYELNPYTTLELENNNDNINRNRLLFGIRFSMGGYTKEEKQRFGLSTRLLEPIEHDHFISSHKAMLGIANSSNGGSVVSEGGSGDGSYEDEGEQEQHDNVWYFRPAGNGNQAEEATGDGTKENPFIGFNTDAYNSVFAHKDDGNIDQHPLMYFATGAYSFSGFTSRGFSDHFGLPNGWGMYGRTSNFRAPATGANYAEFAGTLDLNYQGSYGNDPNILSSIKVLNTKPVGEVMSTSDWGTNVALYLNNAKNVILKNSAFVSSVDQESMASVLALYAEDSTVHFVDGYNYISSIYSGNAEDSFAAGILPVDSIINFDGGNNYILVNGGGVYGLFNYQFNGVLNFNGGVNNINLSSNSMAMGILWAGGEINLCGGQTTISTTVNNGNAVGLYVAIGNMNVFSSANNALEVVLNGSDVNGILLDRANIRYQNNESWENYTESNIGNLYTHISFNNTFSGEKQGYKIQDITNDWNVSW